MWLGNIMIATTVFDSGDKPFMEWLSANPHGFVMNTNKSVGTSYVRFHRAACRHISRVEIAQANAYTTSTYIKVCAGNLSDLIEWASTNRRKAVTYVTCKECNVDIDALASTLPEEIPASVHFEGAAREIKVNAYERNPLARKLCLEVYGCSCVVCGFNFEKVFGQFAAGFIHVHHLVPLSDIGQSYEVDPIRDLRPVCPNCHAAIHMSGVVRSIEEVKELLIGRLGSA
jgi:hypothetical protein